MSRVLLVDDCEGVREAIAMVMRMDGHDVRCVESGAGALEALGVGEFEAVVVDLGMPGMDGVSFVETMRRMEKGRGMPVVVLTGAAHADKVRLCEDLGVLACLVKGTFRISELSVLIENAVLGRSGRGG